MEPLQIIKKTFHSQEVKTHSFLRRHAALIKLMIYVASENANL